jgi:Type II secretion system (T2SS), protein E, N-terminal domain
MLSSEGQPTDTGITGELVSSDTQIQWDKELDYGKIFQLIESFLSFEACLYHQMLPLRFENKSLILGMVNLDDEAALDYVSRILSYVHCTMVKVAMTADNHRSILSAYLNYKNTSEPSGGQLSPPESNPSPQQTDDSSLAQPQVESSVNTTPSDSSPITQLHKEMEESGIDTGLITTKPPILILPKPEELIPVELLTTLPPKKFLEELLGRVIVGGIGRLYFERW